MKTQSISIAKSAKAPAIKANKIPKAAKAPVVLEQPKLETPVGATISHSAFTQFVKQAEEAVVEVINENIVNTFEAELAALQAKHGVTATVKYATPKAEKTAKVSRIVQNDITRPAGATLCGLIWSVCDDHTTPTSPAQISVIRADAMLKTVNDHTIKTQYARWRKFNGVSGYLASVSKTVVQGEDSGLTPL